MSLSTPLANIGVTGLAVMGSNLARNLARHGHVVAVHNRSVVDAAHDLLFSGLHHMDLPFLYLCLPQSLARQLRKPDLRVVLAGLLASSGIERPCVRTGAGIRGVSSRGRSRCKLCARHEPSY